MNKRYVGIDISTKTGLVILDENGEAVHSEEITFPNDIDPERMLKIWNRIESLVNLNTDVFAIEGFSFASKGQGSDFQYGMGWITRLFLHMKGSSYFNVAPTQVKKFATGKGTAGKEALILPLYKKWGYEHESDNCRDAFVLARIAWSTDNIDKLNKLEQAIVNDVMNPKETKRKKK